MCAPLSTLNCIQSASYVKQKARQCAYHQWSVQWQLDHGTSLFCDSPTYNYAITQPPDGHNHPLFIASIPPKKPPHQYVTIIRPTSCIARPPPGSPILPMWLPGPIHLPPSL